MAKLEKKPRSYDLEQRQFIRGERAHCSEDISYFISAYVHIFNANELAWVPFDLWPAQNDLLPTMVDLRYQIVLKARQLGLTWLYLAYILWRMVLFPAATVGIWSKTENEAIDLLSFRLKGMYDRLPDWMRARRVLMNNSTHWYLSNGSRAMAFATTGGRSYTFSLALVDEADYQPDLSSLLSAVEPTVAAGGQLMMISSSNKDLPISRFKSTYVGAKANENRWTEIFLPWDARPERDEAWYEETARDSVTNTGSMDEMWGEYPATDAQALAPRELDKRIPSRWLTLIYVAQKPLSLELVASLGLPSLPHLEVYRLVEEGHRYVIGGDPAEGNPNSDPSALCVLDVETGEEVAALTGRIEPTILAGYADELARYFNDAGIMFERNNHGHACLAWLADHSRCERLRGNDGRPGWLSNSLGKILLYTAMSDCARDQQMTMHSFETYSQLASIEAATLRAPDGMHDDRADAIALAHVGRLAVLATPEEELTPPTFGMRR